MARAQSRPAQERDASAEPPDFSFPLVRTPVGSHALTELNRLRGSLPRVLALLTPYLR